MTVDLEVPAYISYSSYSTYLECPYLYYLSRVLKLEEQPAYWFYAGTAVHAALDAVDDALLNGFDPATTPLHLGCAAFDETFTAEIATAPAGSRIRSANRGKENEKWWRAEAPHMIDRYVQWRLANPDLTPWTTDAGEVAIELGIDIPITEHTTVKGFIDRVFVDQTSAELIIIDFKSGKTVPNAIQLPWYRLLLQEKYGVSPRFGAYWMGRTGQLDAIHDLDRFPVETVRAWADGVYQNIARKFFPARVSYDCKDCGLATMCYTQNNELPVPPQFF